MSVRLSRRLFKPLCLYEIQLVLILLLIIVLNWIDSLFYLYKYKVHDIILRYGRQGIINIAGFRYYWGLAQGDSISHDSYLCNRYPNTKGWPTQRYINQTFNFVGGGNGSLVLKCPTACRPKDHMDWEYCWSTHSLNLTLENKKRCTNRHIFKCF